MRAARLVCYRRREIGGGVRLPWARRRQRNPGYVSEAGNIAVSGRHNCWGFIFALWVPAGWQKLLYQVKTVDPITYFRVILLLGGGG